MTEREKYEDLLARLRKAKGDNDVNDERYCCVIDTIVPELREGGDERIRKAIKKALQVRCDGSRIISDEPVTLKEAIAWLEKQGEQKPADKVEPKFHEGEWLCENEPNNYARFIQILETVNVQGKERYRISRDIHNDEDIVEFDFAEKYYHRFDIKDAKDGDVLVYEGEIFMIKSYVLWHKIVYHCCYDGKILHRHSIYDSWKREDFDKVHPATKEQRDTLERCMTNAGYTFDFEKKELKKIEQKPVWSEEDEEMYKKVETAINSYYAPFSRDAEEMSEWFKSLKDRVQPKQEWSQEDCQYLLVCKNALRKYQISDKWDAEIISHWLENKMKVHQSTWKPSDEQIMAIQTAIGIVGELTPTSMLLKELRGQLKKLKG